MVLPVCSFPKQVSNTYMKRLPPNSSLRTRAIIRRQHLAEIILYKGESLEQALRRFKRQVLREGILKEAKRRTFYLKPSESKKLKSKLARAKNRRQRQFGGVTHAAPSDSRKR